MATFGVRSSHRFLSTIMLESKLESKDIDGA